MTLLCLDCGNTRLKWGLRADGAWLAQGACASEDALQLAAQLPQRPQLTAACNVAGAAAAAHIEALANTLATPLAWFASSAAAGGVRNGYEQPERLGADRWAALIGARSLCAEAALVVNAGTATTIDLLDADGFFPGGLILPGIDLCLHSLHRRTAGLPLARGGFRPTPNNTEDAIVSGAIAAHLGAIELMARRISAPPPASPPVCLLSGGAAAQLAAPLAQAAAPLRLRCVENLVLEGLACIYV